MASAREIQYIIKARDEATAIFKKMGQEGSQAAQDIAKAFDIATNAGAKHEKQVSALSRWIREDKKEKREHNYLYKQGTEIVGAASIALALFGNTVGQANEKNKKLTDSLNAGFIGFQGISTALFMLPGPVGLVAGAIGGLAIAFAKLTSNTEAEAAAQEKVNKLFKEYYEGINLENTQKALIANEARLKLQEDRFKIAEAAKNSWDVESSSLAQLANKIADLTTSRSTEYKSAKNDYELGKQNVEILKIQVESLKQLEVVEMRRNVQKQKSKSDGPELRLPVESTEEKVRRMLAATHNLVDKTRMYNKDLEKAMKDVNTKVIQLEEEATARKAVETQARIIMIQQEIEAEMQSYDAHAKFGVQLNKVTNEAIRAYIARAVAAQLASVFESIPFPFNIIAAPAAGLAVQALLEELIPKFSRGTPRGGFLVPPGYPNDSFRVGVSSGERVNVTPASQVSNSNVTVHVHINAPGTTVSMVRKAVIEGMRQTGLKVDKFFADNSNNLSLSST